MAAPVTIGKMSRRVTIESYLMGKNAVGGNTKTLYTSKLVWSSVRRISGSKLLEQLGIEYKEAYEFYMRYKPVKQFTNELLYEDARLLIGDIEEITEGVKSFVRVIAYTTGAPTSASESTEILCNWQQVDW